MKDEYMKLSCMTVNGFKIEIYGRVFYGIREDLVVGVGVGINPIQVWTLVEEDSKDPTTLYADPYSMILAKARELGMD